MLLTNSDYPEHRKSENDKQGYWGEMYVKNFYEKQGWLIFMNPDPWGGWDMLKINPRTGESWSIQVKTLVQYVTKHYFGIKDGVKSETIDNLKACDELILVVRNPHSIDDKDYKGKVLLVKNHKKFTMKGKEYIIPSKAEHFEQISTLTLDELNQVSSFQTHKEKK